MHFYVGLALLFAAAGAAADIGRDKPRFRWTAPPAPTYTDAKILCNGLTQIARVPKPALEWTATVPFAPGIYTCFVEFASAKVPRDKTNSVTFPIVVPDRPKNVR